MQSTIRLHAKVLPGKRIEVTSPELPESGDVELVIFLPESAPEPKPPHLFEEVIGPPDSLPVKRSPKEWAEDFLGTTDFDLSVPLPPKQQYKVKATIKSVKKGTLPAVDLSDLELNDFSSRRR